LRRTRSCGVVRLSGERKCHQEIANGNRRARKKAATLASAEKVAAGWRTKVCESQH
jgi:hypothetical protein